MFRTPRYAGYAGIPISNGSLAVSHANQSDRVVLLNVSVR